MEPEVSVIIPTTHSRPKELARAVASVNAQTFTNYELIIEDDRARTGVSNARNRGFLKAKGKYIVFLDDDNELLPDFLKETVYMLTWAPDFVGGIRVGKKIMQPEYEDYAAPFNHTGFESIDWGFLMRREVLENIKYDENIYGDDDADFGIRFAEKYQSIPIDKPLGIVWANDEDSMCAPTPRRLAGLAYFLKKHLPRYKQNRNELRYIYRLAGRNYYKGGYKLKGISYFVKSFLAFPNYRTFKHLSIIFGWDYYNKFMDKEEKLLAKQRMS